MTPRFHAPAARATGEVIALPEEEAAHLTRVLRLAVGDAVRVFDGRGQEFDAVVSAVDRRHVEVRLGDTRTPARESRVTMTLVQAVLKGDKMDDVIRDAVMLGVVDIQPLVSGRVEVTRPTLTRARRQERWQRIAVSSAKQCGRAVVPRVLDAIDFDGLVAGLASKTLPVPAMMFVEPHARGGVAKVADLRLRDSGLATVIIGPEGGWAETEIERVAPMATLVTLGGRTLRADVAAVVALSALQTMLGEF